MKKLIFPVLLALVWLCPSVAKAANYAWPENYQGVMLQGFYWDSYTDTKWTNLTAQRDELSKYFSLIWVPNSAKSASGYMGYDPVYWFTNHNTKFGTEKQLREMIAAYKEVGVGIIEDVVVNHRSGKSNWTDFPAEQWNGKTWQLGPEHICSTDEVRNEAGQAKPTGAPDTGEDFDGARDLDHTNATVQDNVKNYCKFLLEDLGYAGFRYDMVKGYGGQYTKIYNEYSKPRFSVGEYWDGNYDALKNWIEATGRQSAAFDFAFKYAVNEAFHSGDLTKLVWKANGDNDQPAGLIHFAYSQYAVTFIDNHDTYRDGSKFNGNVLAANAFMLFSPGTPCVFLPHYKEHKAEIQKMIEIRNAVGIHNMSAVRVLRTSSDCYMAEITGTKGKAVVKVGSAMVSPEGYSDSDIKATGSDYCIWSKVGGIGGGDIPVGESFNVYYDNSVSKWTTPYIHYWGASESTWPGVAMTKVEGDVWTYKVPAGTTGILFNAGDGDATKTSDFVAVANGLYNQSGQNGTYGGGDIPVGNPFTVYYDNTSTAWPTPYIHYWGASESTWPGVAMTKVEGNIWSYTVPAGTTGILFNAGDGDATKTDDFVAVPNGLYTHDGQNGTYVGGSGGDEFPTKLYMVGTINGGEWETSKGLLPDEAAEGVYTYNNVTVEDAGEGFGYLTFLTNLDELDGEWNGANQGDRYGAPAADTPLELGGSAPVRKYAYMVDAMAAESWKIPVGKYNVVVNLKDMLITLSGATGSVTVEIEQVETPIYFNMQGVRVAEPGAGIYIVRRGNNLTKQVIR